MFCFVRKSIGLYLLADCAMWVSKKLSANSIYYSKKIEFLKNCENPTGDGATVPEENSPI